MVNQRFLHLAERQRDEDFLVAEERKAQEARAALEAYEARERAEIERARLRHVEQLKADASRTRELTDYVVKMNAFRDDTLSTALYAFTEHPDFALICNQTQTIKRGSDRWAFILRRAYEIGDEAIFPIGSVFSSNATAVQRTLDEYGIRMLCPYFRENSTQATREECLIDGEPIMSLCGGQYDTCVIFKDRVGRAALGDFSLPQLARQPVRGVPVIPVEPVDLEDLADWWNQEGKYT